MNVTLRKASALQNAINDTIKGIQLKVAVNLSEFQDAETVISKSRQTLLTNVDRKVALTKALYAIRSAVGAANNTTVDALLAQVAQVEKTIQLYTELAGAEVREEAAVIAGKLEKIKNRPADVRPSYYGNSDEISTGVLTTTDIESFRSFIALAKKNKQALQDQILEANVRTEITLDADTVATLTAENLL